MRRTGINNIVCMTEYDSVHAAIHAPANCIEVSKPDGGIERRPKARTIELENGTTVFPHEHNYVSNIIDEWRICEMLQKRGATVIDSQTGSGKSTFVFKKVYKIIHEWKKRMLVLCSRKALKSKDKYDAIKAAAPELARRLTDEGIEYEHCFNDIDVYSYQDIDGDNVPSRNRESILQGLKRGEYGVVIFDEIHYAVADADFSWSTERVFDWLLGNTIRYQIPRIYLSGTMQDVYDKIVEKEKYYQQRTLGFAVPAHIDFHYFRRDYSYLDVHFFRDETELLTQINGSEDQKWLILVDSRSMAAELKRQISLDSFILDSAELHRSDRGDESQKVIDGLTREGTLKVDVLLVTKCLDVGVDVLDRNVNVVCYLTNRTDFIQAIGRKRPQGNEWVNLWIPLYKGRDVKGWLQRTASQIVAFRKVMDFCPEGKLVSGRMADMPVYIDQGRYAYNTFSVYKLNCFLDDWEPVAETIESMKETEQQQYIARHFLGWMELTDSASNLTNLFGAHGLRQRQLLEVIEPWMTKAMDKAEFEEFSQALSEAGFDARKELRDDRGAMGLSKVNEVLAEVNLIVIREKDLYKIHSKGGN